MNISEIYSTLLAKGEPKPLEQAETMGNLIEKNRTFIESEIERRFLNISPERMRNIHQCKEAENCKFYPTIEIDFSNPYTWLINLGIMAISKDGNRTFHVLDSSPYNAFLQIGNQGINLKKTTLECLFPNQEKIPLTGYGSDVKKNLFIFKV